MYFYNDEDEDDYDDDMSLDYMPSQQQQTREDTSPPVPPPSPETMEQRLHFRQSIREKTLEHRRVQEHGGMGDTGRNVALVLRDREQRGARHATLQQSPDTKAGRSMTYPMTVSWELQTFSEYSSVTKYHASYLSHLRGTTSADDEESQSHQNDEAQDRSAAPASAVSTISIAFSPDSQTMASTHGDHTVKITSCHTGNLLRTLEGHPRTPWTVKYHPTDGHILASGCLGCQVRVWNWNDGICLKMIRLDHAIISLSFHPSGHVLAIASGSRLHFWDYANYAGADGNADSRGALTEVEQRHMLRCVHFPPNGNTLIVGGSNPPTDEQRRRRTGMTSNGMSFYLRLWDFDLIAALHPEERDARDVLTTPPPRNRRKPLENVSTNNGAFFPGCSCAAVPTHFSHISMSSIATNLCAAGSLVQ
jgi:activator-of-BECN1-regulated-autophagy protein 1